MFGEAIAYGAATIVNALATGRGSAFGVELWTKASVELTDKLIIEGKIISDPEEDTSLIKECVSTVLKKLGLENNFGAKVETESNIPIARGMKSSSVVSNAVVLATLGAIGTRMDDLDIIKLGVEASINSKKTVTGAFDDACASYFGGIVITDNLKMNIVKKLSFDDDLMVIFKVPEKKSYTHDLDKKRLRIIAQEVEVAYNEAIKGNILVALIMNGLFYSALFGYDPGIAIRAIEAGAIASGLTGKGPAVVAIVNKNDVDAIIEAWSAYDGYIIKTVLNNKKSHLVKVE